MSLPRVKLYGDWNQDASQMLDNLQLFTKGFDGDVYDDSVEFVREGNQDFSVVFNFPLKGELPTPPQRNIGLVLEPPEILKRMYPRWTTSSVPGVEHYYSFSTGSRFPHAPGIGFASCSYRDVPEQPKRDRVCMIASQKRFTPWHEKRHEILNALLETDIPIDFYGRGMPDIDDSRVMGEIPPELKRLVTKQYHYVVDFENSGYGAVTDKFFDPILTGAMPVTNAKILEQIAPKDSFRLIDFDKPTDEIVKWINALTGSTPNDTEKQAMAEAKAQITSGSMSLTKWIRDRVVELNG